MQIADAVQRAARKVIETIVSQLQRALALQQPAVRQLRAAKRQVAIGGDLPLVRELRQTEGQAGRTVQRAAVEVVETIGEETERAIALQQPAVGYLFAAQRQRVAQQRAAVSKAFLGRHAGGGGARFAAVAQALRRHVQRAFRRLGAVQRGVAGGNREIAPALQLRALLRGDGVTGQRQVACGHRLTAQIGVLRGIQPDVALTGGKRSLTGCGVLSAGLNALCAGKRAVLRERAGVYRQRAVGEDFTAGAVIQAFAGRECGITAGAEGALLIERRCVQRNLRAALQRAAVGHGVAFNVHAVALQRTAVSKARRAGFQTALCRYLPAVGQTLAGKLRTAACAYLPLTGKRAAVKRDVVSGINAGGFIQRDGVALQRLALTAGERAGG
ncbi:hypothetical protein BN135_3165 [Cronobacter muytjensii 530]